ncbi:rod shape-determining protein MreC [Erysipelothrix sp. HDW6C]|uniref:rod shape-determining protein MreC n=1 Tax=Erysipelothrix sp. HDW6C TaxID=2714930 RepID=UPI0014094137|nr:rod shape-determining protein MreC [Erysipelothrix sp. HDW6C]QIK70214.1 rod shape-determining protein MreC [Erysipelothrix sp. HDW6C]
MKQKSRFKRVLLGLLITIIVALLGMNFVKNSAFYQSVDRNFFGFISMLRYGLIDYPIETVSNFTNDVATMWDVRYENDRLREELDAAAHMNTYIRALEAERDELKELNGLNSLYTENELIKGMVSNRSSEKWDSVVNIDIGRNQGVAVNDGVMTSHGVIGRVIDVNDDSAVVALLVANDDNSRVSVSIEVAPGEYVPGILESYNHEKGVFTVRLLETTSSITADMLVSTSGGSGVYPRGLLVGKVESVKNISEGTGVEVYVKSSVNFDNIGYIAVVKRP